MLVDICSLNVRGLGNKLKRDQVFHWLKEQSFDIYFLQETHLPSSFKNQIETEWGQNVFLSGSSRNSEGVCILLNNDFICNVIKHNDIITGRLQAIDIQYNDIDMTIINIYGPNNDEPTFFDSLNNYIIQNEENTFIIGGDFNTVLDPHLDKKTVTKKHIKNVESQLNQF